MDMPNDFAAAEPSPLLLANHQLQLLKQYNAADRAEIAQVKLEIEKNEKLAAAIKQRTAVDTEKTNIDLLEISKLEEESAYLDEDIKNRELKCSSLSKEVAHAGMCLLQEGNQLSTGIAAMCFEYQNPKLLPTEKKEEKTGSVEAEALKLQMSEIEKAMEDARRQLSQLQEEGEKLKAAYEARTSSSH